MCSCSRSFPIYIYRRWLAPIRTSTSGQAMFCFIRIALHPRRFSAESCNRSYTQAWPNGGRRRHCFYASYTGLRCNIILSFAGSTALSDFRILQRFPLIPSYRVRMKGLPTSLPTFALISATLFQTLQSPQLFNPQVRDT